MVCTSEAVSKRFDKYYYRYYWRYCAHDKKYTFKNQSYKSPVLHTIEPIRSLRVDVFAAAAAGSTRDRIYDNTHDPCLPVVRCVKRVGYRARVACMRRPCDVCV